MSNKKKCPRYQNTVFAGCAMCAGNKVELASQCCARRAAEDAKQLYDRENTRAYAK